MRFPETHRARAPSVSRRAPSPQGLRLVLAVFGGYALSLTVLALTLSPAEFRELFSEQGPFELLSIPAWLMLAAWCLDFSRPMRLAHWVCGALAALAAAREADWHKAFTTDNIFKSNYYFDTVAPLSEKVPAALVALAAIGLLLAALGLGLRFVLREGIRRHAWMHTMVLGTVMLVATKLLDRSISIAEDDFGIHVGRLIAQLISAYEEGFELSLPLVFGAALVQLRRSEGAPAAESTGRSWAPSA